jgi:hypothetical protein
LSSREDPAPLFAPVAEYLDSQPATVLDLQRQLASMRWALTSGGDVWAPLAAAEDRMVRIAAQLTDTDQAALRLHPWSREIRLAAKDAPR